MKIRYIATVHIMVDAEDETEAYDAISGLLTEGGIYDGNIVDWSYVAGPSGTEYLPAQPYETDDDWDRDEDCVQTVVATKTPLATTWA